MDAQAVINALRDRARQAGDWMQDRYGAGLPRTEGENTRMGYARAALRGVLGMDSPEEMTPGQRDVYENALRIGAPAQGLGVGKAIFIGAKARNWNKANADKFIELEKQGLSNRDAFAQTGTFRSPDGMLRQEIDDSLSVPGQRLYTWGEAADLKAQNTVPVRRQKALLHPQLSAAYPDTKQIGVVLKPGSPNGSYLADADVITVGAGKNGAANRPVMLHELQHAVQQREGFAGGGTPGEFQMGPMFDKRASDLAAELSKNINGSVSAKPQEIIQSIKYGEPQELEAIAKRFGFNDVPEAISFLAKEDAKRTPFGQYQRLAGEAEARAVEARMNLSAAERAKRFPLDDYDVPVESLIIRALRKKAE